jgi:hypothetical protein
VNIAESAPRDGHRAIECQGFVYLLLIEALDEQTDRDEPIRLEDINREKKWVTF